ELLRGRGRRRNLVRRERGNDAQLPHSHHRRRLMAEMSQPKPTLDAGWSAGRVLLALLPLLGLGIAIALIFLTTSGILNSALPPVEDITVERVTLPADGMIEMTLVNGGADPVTIAQVIVD